MKPKILIEKFIYGCSHDLRSPVASILGLVRIAEYYPHSADLHQCLEMIEACTYEMNNKISKLQEYLANGLRPLSIGKLCAEEVIEEIRAAFKPQLDMLDIELISDINTTKCWNADKQSVHTILKYLVSNSIAFHNPKQEDRKIVIGVKIEETGSTLEVSDNGLGIPEAMQAKIFDIFFKGTENTIGPGMGLFLVHSLVEKMGGTISCRSEVGKCTTMHISLPDPQ